MLPPSFQQADSPAQLLAALVAEAQRHGRPLCKAAQGMLAAVAELGDEWPQDNDVRRTKVLRAVRLVSFAVRLADRTRSPEVTVRIMALAIIEEL